MKGRISIHWSDSSKLHLNYLYKKLRNTDYGYTLSAKNIVEENSDGKKASKLSIPSPFFKINKQEIKSRIDLIHV